MRLLAACPGQFARVPFHGHPRGVRAEDEEIPLNDRRDVKCIVGLHCSEIIHYVLQQYRLPIPDLQAGQQRARGIERAPQLGKTLLLFPDLSPMYPNCVGKDLFNFVMYPGYVSTARKICATLYGTSLRRPALTPIDRSRICQLEHGVTECE